MQFFVIVKLEGWIERFFQIILKKLNDFLFSPFIILLHHHKMLESLNLFNNQFFTDIKFFDWSFWHNNTIFRNVWWIVLKLSIFWEIKLDSILNCWKRINHDSFTLNVLRLHKRKTSIWNLHQQSDLFVLGWYVGHYHLTLISMIHNKVIKFFILASIL